MSSIKFSIMQSLQRLSSSASNNRLKTCLQFLIIKVNEKSIAPPQTSTTTTNSKYCGVNYKSQGVKEAYRQTTEQSSGTLSPEFKHQPKRLKSHNQSSKQRQQHNHQLQKHKQLASPPQDQVSSTQDQVVPEHNDHDCQTSPLMLVTTNIDEPYEVKISEENLSSSPSITQEEVRVPPTQAQSSPNLQSVTTITAVAPTTTVLTVSASTSTSPSQTDSIDGTNTIYHDSKLNINLSQEKDQVLGTKRRDMQNGLVHDNASTTSWSSSYSNPTSPASSTSSISSASSDESSTCSSSVSSYPSQSPLSSPDIINELKRPRFKLSEEKIRRIKKRPISFDDYYLDHSIASTPTTSSLCSPGQHSTTTQNSDQSRLGFSSTNVVIHMFQAPPRFVNNLKPCNLPSKPQHVPQPSNNPIAPTREMLNCAICGIKDRPPNITKIFGQNSCLLCNRFFSSFLRRPQQLYCAQDGDCLMTFDSRCQACWIKICLQKFDIDEEHRKIGQKFSPKLLSSPNVSLITIDTSSPR